MDVNFHSATPTKYALIPLPYTAFFPCRCILQCTAISTVYADVARQCISSPDPTNSHLQSNTILGTLVCTDQARGGDTTLIKNNDVKSAVFKTMNNYFVTFPGAMHNVYENVCMRMCVCLFVVIDAISFVKH